MPRELKPVVIETITGRHSGLTVTVYYDRNRHDHYAQVGEEVFRDLDVHKVRSWAHKAADAAGSYAWFPVVELDIRASDYLVDRARRDAAGVVVRAQRYFLARRLDGRYLVCDWEFDVVEVVARDARGGAEHERRSYAGVDAPPGARLKRATTYSQVHNSAEIVLPHLLSDNDERGATWLLPYSERLWANVQEVLDRLRVLHARLLDLVNSEEGRARFASANVLKQLDGPKP